MQPHPALLRCAGLRGSPAPERLAAAAAAEDEAMSEIVNLRIARKAKARSDGKAQAAANRAAFGRAKAEKAASIATKDNLQRALDQARRER